MLKRSLVVVAVLCTLGTALAGPPRRGRGPGPGAGPCPMCAAHAESMAAHRARVDEKLSAVAAAQGTDAKLTALEAAVRELASHDAMPCCGQGGPCAGGACPQCPHMGGPTP